MWNKDELKDLIRILLSKGATNFIVDPKGNSDDIYKKDWLSNDGLNSLVNLKIGKKKEIFHSEFKGSELIIKAKSPSSFDVKLNKKSVEPHMKAGQKPMFKVGLDNFDIEKIVKGQTKIKSRNFESKLISFSNFIKDDVDEAVLSENFGFFVATANGKEYSDGQEFELLDKGSKYHLALWSPSQKKLTKSITISKREFMKNFTGTKDPTNESKFDEALTTAQHLKRKAAFKKNKGKIARAKEKASKRIASPDKIKDKANKKARDILTKKILGGRSKSDLSLGDRKSLEKKLDKKKATIAKIGKKLRPQVKKDNKASVAKARARGKEE